MKSSKGIGAAKLRVVKHRAPRDKTATNVKKVLGHGGGVAEAFDPSQHQGEWARSRGSGVEPPTLQKMLGEGKERSVRKVPREVEAEAIEARLGGATQEEIASKYGVAESYIDAVIKRKFMNTEVGRKILQSVLLENAIASGEHTRQNIDKLQPMQAAVVTGIMTQRFVELQKHAKDNPPDIDLAQLGELGSQINELVKLVGPGVITEAEIVEVEEI